MIFLKIPLEIEYVKGTIIIVKNAGNASLTLSHFINPTGPIINLRVYLDEFHAFR